MKRGVTADEVQDLISVQGVSGKAGFYKVQSRRHVVIVTNPPSKYRYQWVWVSECAFGSAPLTFGLAAAFPIVGNIEDSELWSMICSLSAARHQSSVFDSPDLMAIIGWFVLTVPMACQPIRSGFSEHELEEPELGGNPSSRLLFSSSSFFFYTCCCASCFAPIFLSSLFLMILPS